MGLYVILGTSRNNLGRDGICNKLRFKMKLELIPCFQYRVLPAKPLSRLKYIFLEIEVGFAKKHITYHLFMQNFEGLARVVWLPHDFE